MRTTRMIVTGLAACCLGLAGCQGSLKEENSLLLEENRELRAQHAELAEAMEATAADLEAAQAMAEQDRARLEASEQGPTTGFEGISGVNATFGAAGITASISGDVLFASGQTTLKNAAKKSLNEVAMVLTTKYPGQTVRIVGHTDTDPIKKSGFKSNYHLGFARAYSVREYLVSKGVQAERLAIASEGANRSLATKAASRRVEIVVEP